MLQLGKLDAAVQGFETAYAKATRVNEPLPAPFSLSYIPIHVWQAGHVPPFTTRARLRHDLQQAMELGADGAIQLGVASEMVRVYQQGEQEEQSRQRQRWEQIYSLQAVRIECSIVFAR